MNSHILKSNRKKSPKMAVTKGWDGKEYDLEKEVKAGECIFPYKVLEKKGKIFNECNYHYKKSKKERGKICATSLSEKGPHKGYMNTYGFCKQPPNFVVSKHVTIDKSSNTNRVSNNNGASNNNLPKTPTDWIGPKKGYLKGNCKDDIIFQDFEKAVVAVNKNDSCSGITKKKKSYIGTGITKTPNETLKPIGITNETSWIKKSKFKKNKFNVKKKLNSKSPSNNNGSSNNNGASNNNGTSNNTGSSNNNYNEYPNPPDGWNGPHKGQFLTKLVKDSNGIHIKDISNFEKAIKKADKYDDCTGITKTSKGYSLRKSLTMKKQTTPNVGSGLACWTKKANRKSPSKYDSSPLANFFAKAFNDDNSNNDDNDDNANNTSYPEAPDGWNGPHKGQFLTNVVKDSNGKKIKDISNFEEAIKKADKYDSCSGISKTKKGYSLRKSNNMKKQTGTNIGSFREYSWTKKKR